MQTEMKLWIAFSSILIVFLTGCTSMPPPKSMASVISPRPIASFTLDVASPTVRELLIQLRRHAPNAMQMQGLAEPLFEDEADGQWATVSFKNPPWIYWSLGVQFLRKPDETGKNVEAWMRIVGGRNNTNPDPTKLEPSTIESMRKALEAAATKR